MLQSGKHVREVHVVAHHLSVWGHEFGEEAPANEEMFVSAPAGVVFAMGLSPYFAVVRHGRAETAGRMSHWNGPVMTHRSCMCHLLQRRPEQRPRGAAAVPRRALLHHRHLLDRGLRRRDAAPAGGSRVHDAGDHSFLLPLILLALF